LIRSFLARLIGGDRPKIVAVFGADGEELERAIGHARSGSGLPIWAWCREALEKAPEGCERFFQGSSALSEFQRALRERWVALSIVPWTGRGGFSRLRPFAIPPFRVLVMNEAGDFFPAKPLPVAQHLARRLRECLSARMQLAGEWTMALGGIVWSLLFRCGQRLRDLFFLGVSLAWRGMEHARDIWVLFYHFSRSRTAFLLHLKSELILAALAFCARRVPNLALSMVEKERRSTNPGARMAEDSFIEIPHAGRGWQRRRILEKLRSSHAEFVVFRHEGEPGEAKWLIAMAVATGAFAAARQAGHSAWRAKVVDKHPFRRLHGNETSEVAAPDSGLIVMRRETLLALGCPRALTWGAALMLIFRKASAAGLKSIVVGHGGPVPDEAATALEDLEYAVRVKLSSQYRAMAPAFPDQLRGNIACSPWHRRALRGKPRVLVVSPYLPFPLSHGGAVRIYNLCRELAAEIDFILACFREANETVHYDELHEVFREVYVVDNDEKHPPGHLPAQVAEYRNSAMAGLISRLCGEGWVDVLQLEYTQLAEYARCAGEVPVVLVEHDITLTLYRQMAERTGDEAARQEYWRWLNFERAALESVGTIWTMSGHDRATAIQHGAPRGRTLVVQNGVDLGRYGPAAKRGTGQRVLFVGSFRHRPNLLAFEELRERIMPEVWRKFPHATLHVIAGPEHERAAAVAGRRALLREDPRIALEGFVTDVRPAYREADVVVIPLPVSAGTNIKLTEAMACQRAIVSTPSGCRGLHLSDGKELMVSELAGFADAICALLEDEGLRARIAGEARITAEERFGWDSIARGALECYRTLVLPHLAREAVGD